MGRLTAADELDDFKAVVVVEQRIGPAVALDDRAVELDGDTIFFQFEQAKERLQAGCLRDLTRLAIDEEFHSGGAAPPQGSAGAYGSAVVLAPNSVSAQLKPYLIQ